jgi:hypothetical protein
VLRRPVIRTVVRYPIRTIVWYLPGMDRDILVFLAPKVNERSRENDCESRDRADHSSSDP